MFAKKFRIIEIDNIIKMKDIILREKITNAYIQSHGCHRDFYQLNSRYIWQNCITSYHYVFGPMIRQGSDVRCVIGGHLNKRFNKNIDVLPYIVEKFDFCGDMREELKIPRDALVFGRYGGLSTFDIEFVHEAIKEILKLEKKYLFCFYEYRSVLQS